MLWQRDLHNTSFVIATSFFIKQAFDNNLIGNLGRVALGVLGGTALCVVVFG